MTAALPDDPRLVLRMHIGLGAMAKLAAFSQMIVTAWPTLYVVAFGSALRTKEWRDVDVACVMDGEHALSDLLYDPYATTPPGTAGGPARFGAPYEVMSAAFTALAREMVGIPVEVRIQRSSALPSPHVLLAGEAYLGSGDKP